MSSALTHIFLSYCRENGKDVAALRQDLIDLGETVWWDQELLPGKDWRFAIRQAMEASYAFILCWSREAQDRIRSGIYTELEDAIDFYREYAPGNIFLIPVRLSECELPPIPISGRRTLRDLQYVDLFPPDARPAGLARLIQAIREARSHHP